MRLNLISHSISRVLTLDSSFRKIVDGINEITSENLHRLHNDVPPENLDKLDNLLSKLKVELVKFDVNLDQYDLYGYDLYKFDGKRNALKKLSYKLNFN